MTNMPRCVIKNKMPSTFQLIVGSKQTYLRKPPQDLVDIWLLNAILNVNLQTTNNFQQGFTSHFNNSCFRKFIVDSVSEGAWTPLSMLIVGCRYSKIFLHFCNNCRIFCEGVKGSGDGVVKLLSANYHNLAIGPAFGHNKLVKLITAFGHNEHVELIMAFGHNQLVELITAFTTSLSNSSRPLATKSSSSS